MNKQIQKSMTDIELDKVLEASDIVKPPADFTQSVMNSINGISNNVDNTANTKVTWWQWLALISGGIPAITQTLALVFGAWNIANIG
jgi:hypothetical protein